MLRSVVAGMFLLGAGAVHAQSLGENLRPEEIGSVSISLIDNAGDACWTNLKEVREYAEEKLRGRGYQLRDDSSALVNYTLMINVNAFRHQAAPTCVSSIAVNIMKALTSDGVFGFHVIAMKDIIVTSPLNGNVNNRVIETVKELVDGM